jgi:hypothetical protein
VVVQGGDVLLSSSLRLGSNSGVGGTTAVGNFSIVNGNLTVGSSLTVGQVSGAEIGKSAVATLNAKNGNLSARRVGVGQASGGGTTSALAKLDNVNGRIQSLQVGESFSPNNFPSGRVELVNSVLDVEEYVAVGLGFGGGTGNGEIELTDSRLNVGVGPDSGAFFGDMFLGSTNPSDTASVMLRRSIIDVADRLVFGAGSELGIRIEGENRVTEYGAIDAQSIRLGGLLDLAFDFLPTVGNAIFDLLVSGSADGISGDFAQVNVVGLDPLFNASSGVELVSFGGEVVEVYRLRIARNAVPEPPTLLLFLMAGVLLILYSGRARPGFPRS